MDNNTPLIEQLNKLRPTPSRNQTAADQARANYLQSVTTLTEEQAKQTPRPSTAWSLFPTRLARTMLLLITVSIILLSWQARNSTVNETLYPLKLGWEQALLWWTNDPATQTELHLLYARQRAAELATFIDSNQANSWQSTLASFEREIILARDLLVTLTAANDPQITTLNQQMVDTLAYQQTIIAQAQASPLASQLSLPIYRYGTIQTINATHLQLNDEMIAITAVSHPSPNLTSGQLIWLQARLRPNQPIQATRITPLTNHNPADLNQPAITPPPSPTATNVPQPPLPTPLPTTALNITVPTASPATAITPSHTPTSLPTATPNQTATNVPQPPLPTPFPTVTPFLTNTPIPLPTATNLPVATNTPLPTNTATATPTATPTPSPTPTNTPLPSPTTPPTASPTPSPVPTSEPTILTIDGILEGLTPQALQIGGLTMTITDQSAIDPTLKVGDWAIVVAEISNNGDMLVVLATANPEDPAPSFMGIIQAITNEGVQIENQLIFITPNTQVEGQLQVGAFAHGHGELMEDGAILAYWIQIDNTIQK